MTTNITAEEIYSLLLAESEHRQMPEIYRTDLTVHDQQALAETGTQRFIWLVRTCGTHLMPLDNLQDVTPENRPHNIIPVYGRGFMNDVKLWFIFDNGRLRQVAYVTALETAEKAHYQVSK